MMPILIIELETVISPQNTAIQLKIQDIAGGRKITVFRRISKPGSWFPAEKKRGPKAPSVIPLYACSTVTAEPSF
jgi:hypothetical protein